MNPIFLLRELGLLQGNKTVLDVGSRDGHISRNFTELGLTVDAIDTCEPEDKLTDVRFTCISVEDFIKANTKKFDLVVMRHVAHLLKDPLTTIKQLNEIAGTFYFTCFGPKDDWVGRVQTLEHKEVLSLFEPDTVRHHSEAYQYGKTYIGDIKFWHIHTFVIKNQDQ